MENVQVFKTVSTHSRLKAAGKFAPDVGVLMRVSTHSRLKAAGPRKSIEPSKEQFQHTAA